MLRIVARINFLIVIITTICYQNQPVYSGDFSSSPLSSSSSYKDKQIGCLYSDLCNEDQVCFDDHAFGRCEQYDPLTETFSSNYIYQLDRKTLQLLEKEWIRLRKSGFDWPDPYMQCILKVILNDRPRIVYNPTVCDKHLTSNGLKFEKNNNEDHIPYGSKPDYDDDLFKNIERELANYLILTSSTSKEDNESLQSSPLETKENDPTRNNDDKQQQQPKRLKNLNKESLTLVPSAQLDQPSPSPSSSLSSSASSSSSLSSKINRKPLIPSLLIESKVDNFNTNNDESGTKNMDPVGRHMDLLQLFPKILTTGALHTNIPMMKKKDHIDVNDNETNNNQKKSLIIDQDQVEEFPYQKTMIDTNRNDVDDRDLNDFDLEQNKKLIDFLEEIIKNGDNNNDYGGDGRYYDDNLNDAAYLSTYKQLLDYYGNSKNNNPNLEEEQNDPMMKRNNHLRNDIMNTIYFSKNNKQPSIESNNDNNVDEQVMKTVDDIDEDQRTERKQQRLLSSPLMSILKIPEIRIIRDTEDDDYNDPLDHITLLESPPLLTTTPSDDDEDIVLVDFDSDNDHIIVGNEILHRIDYKENPQDSDSDFHSWKLNEVIDDKSLKNNLEDNNVESLANKILNNLDLNDDNEKNGINDYDNVDGNNNNEEEEEEDHGDDDEEKEILIGDINYSNNYLMPNFNRHHRYDIKKPGPIYLEDYIVQSSLKNEADNNNNNNKKENKDSGLMKKDFSIRSNQPVAEGPVKLDSTSKDQLIIRTASNDEKTNLEAIDSTHTYVVIDQMLGEEDSESFLQTIEQLFNLPRGTFSNIRKEDYQITFKVNPNYQELNASQVASRIEDSSKLIQDITGYIVKETGIGDKTKLPVVSAKLMKQSNDKIIRMTLLVCTIILSFISAAFVIYLFRRNAKFREKIKGFMKLSEDWIKFDYQDLCRQKFRNKNENSKTENITTTAAGSDIEKSKQHGLKNIDTNAAMQQGTDNQGSPPSRSSTSSYVEEPVSANMDITTGHIILSYMEDHLKNKNRLDREWEALCAYEADPNATNAALQKQNVAKNRYENVLPYDHSRVILNDCANSTNSDYINANTITDHDPRNPAYIATQGPLPNTKADFWQMIWEQGSVLIVMLTRLRENGLNMCDRYWPEEGSEVFENFEVHLVSEHIWCDDYLVRSFYLKNLKTGETRTVTQFHYLSWPENGLPASIKSLLDFRRKVNKSYKGRSCPIVVHCNDGVGRTGTYILIDMVLNRLAKGAKEIDLAASLEHIRDQRGGMVKTKQQFEFVLLAIADEVQAILKTLPN